MRLLRFQFWMEIFFGTGRDSIKCVTIQNSERSVAQAGLFDLLTWFPFHKWFGPVPSRIRFLAHAQWFPGVTWKVLNIEIRRNFIKFLCGEVYGSAIYNVVAAFPISMRPPLEAYAALWCRCDLDPRMQDAYATRALILSMLVERVRPAWSGQRPPDK